MSRNRSRVAIGVGVLLIGALGGWAGVWLRGFWVGGREVTDSGRYTAVLREMGYPGSGQANAPSLAHFPSSIPTSASNVRFFYWPPAIKGGPMLQLRMVLPAGEIAALLAKHRAAAKEIQSGGSDMDAINAHTGSLPSARFRSAANTGFGPLPADFQVFVLDAKDTSASASSPPAWNDGYSYGVAVSPKSNQAIYWVEEW